MRADIRLWTAIAIIGVCGFSIAQGWGIARFSLVNVHASESRAEILSTWAAVPGLASTALQTQLGGSIDPSDLQAANDRREVLSAILTIRPLSSIDWLSLSGVQLITDQPMQQVLGSLLLSMMAGPNEGYVMADRGIFGTSLWEDLSPDLRRHAAMDLVTGEIPQDGKFRAVLSTKSERIQNELRAAILATGLSSKQVERRLGF